MAVLVAETIPYWHETVSPSGPVTETVVILPPQPATSASTVPLASVSEWTNHCSGIRVDLFYAISSALAASNELRLPLKESIAITTFIMFLSFIADFSKSLRIS